MKNGTRPEKAFSGKDRGGNADNLQISRFEDLKMKEVEVSTKAQKG
jgi:hypothetical protein